MLRSLSLDGTCAVWASWVMLALLLVASPNNALAEDVESVVQSEFASRYCVSCHGNDGAEAHLNIEQLAAEGDISQSFRDWERVARMLEERQMPPADSEQPTDAEREAMVSRIRGDLNAYVEMHAGDPGPVVMRRLTSAEYRYTINDLTGLDLATSDDFGGDGVGGAGFTNFGAAQFMQDATLEWYLDAAHEIASHAVIGAGPLEFSEYPGSTGQELMAIQRILRICSEHGIRTAAGEGAEPIGLHRYPAAFFVAWQFRYRDQLGLSAISLEELARAERLPPQFAEHVWKVLSDRPESFPTSLIVSAWNDLPVPDGSEDTTSGVRASCDQLYALLREWQSTLAAASDNEEESPVLTEGVMEVVSTHSFTAEIDWNRGARQAEVMLEVLSTQNEPQPGTIVVWENPRIRFRSRGSGAEDTVPLKVALVSESAGLLSFGLHSTGATIGSGDFAIAGPQSLILQLQVPAGATSARLQVDVRLDLEHGDSGIVRCRISDGAVEGETAAETGASSVLLADPDGSGIDDWLAGTAEFAKLLPEVTHREPAPSDRDPIPAPFDNTYNQNERTVFHTRIKYHRDDDFLVNYMLDDAARASLDVAWTDLLTSFDYHDEYLQFVARKYDVDLGGRTIAELEGAWIESLPEVPRSHISALRDEYLTMLAALEAAEAGHVDDVLALAERAWRRPRSGDEQQRLRHFYTALRNDHDLSHPDAIRMLLVRVLVSPDFLYRAEPNEESEGIVPLSDWELASRLSFFLWSSIPDDELAEAARAGRLQDPAVLEEQTRRMLRDPRAERLAREFFGQWLGFYQFDRHRGVDQQKFPEFDDALKVSLHQECVAFFTYVIQENRPIDEILFADYTFLDERLSQHYRIDDVVLDEGDFTFVTNMSAHQRGGLLGMGAVLTATSAPLRTSPVRRGDYVLRRVLGTPVPPPPADAGSIPADDVRTDGLTVRDRLDAHRRNASCVNCHSRIDPLGFALEHFDALGRWRETYGDGQQIEPSGVLSDGTTVVGWNGLRGYLEQEKELFHQTFCTKLLSYALGRSELLSDRLLIEQMMDQMEHHGQFVSAVVQIVTSRQFREQHARPESFTDGE